jgi:lauroyl/myristoyl acyltransferase
MTAAPYNFQFSISQFFQSPFNVALARMVPLPLFRLYCYILGLFYLAVRADQRQQVAAGVLATLAGGSAALQSGFLLWKTYLGIFEHYYEKLVNAYHPTTQLERYLAGQTEIRNEDWLIQAYRQQRGLLMVSGHFGAVEYLPLFLALKGCSPAMIMRFKTQRLRQESIARCRQFNVYAIDADQPNAALRALQAVKQGRTLITLCDEFTHWRPHPERFVSVLDRRVRADRTLDVLHRRSRPPACLGLVQRTRSGLALQIEPITDGNEAISLAERSWQILEGYIRRHPEQWYQWREVATALTTYEQRYT